MPLSDPRKLAEWADSWWTAAEEIGSKGLQALDPGNLRYGVSTAEKERLASAGALPGAPKDQSENQDVANRYAAGYLFGQNYPNLAPVVQPMVDRIKTSDLPFFGGESPETQAYASYGVNMGAGQPRTVGDFMGRK